MSDAESDDNSRHDGEDGDWGDWGDEAELVTPTRDVLEHNKEHDSAGACLRHCKEAYGWDLSALGKALELDIYGSIRVVNWLRKEVAAKRREMDDAELVKHLQSPFVSNARPAFLDDDDLLFPFLPEDALLPALCADIHGGSDNDETSAAGKGASSRGDELEEEVSRLREQLAMQQELIQQTKATLLNDGACPSNVTTLESTLKRFSQGRPRATWDEGIVRPEDSASPEMSRGETSYFDSYAKIGIHHEMLSDATRTGGYRDFLLNNPSLVKDKIVLDVGCGTGILCMLAAQAGAKLVIGVDMSDIIDDAREIVKANGFDGKIVLLKGKMEEVVLPVEKVDLIVSEWMGYFLLYESMLDSVVFAREKYLAPGGSCMPDRMTMLVAALDDSAHLDFWRDVYGFDYGHIRRKVQENLILEPAVQHWEGIQLLSVPSVFKELKCEELAVKDLEFRAPFKVEAVRPGTCHGLITHFDTYFENRCDMPIIFTTSAEAELKVQTHWKQTTFYLKGGGVAMQKGDVIEGEFHVARAAHNPRHMDIVVSWAFRPVAGSRGEEVFQNFQLH